MTDEAQEKPRGELLIDLIEDLITINYKILKLLDQRVTILEDECSKKEG